MAREKGPAKEKIFEEAMAHKWIALISLGAFLGIGIWMLLVPNGLKHSGYEKSSVYLIKEIWSYETGIVICAISVFFLAKTILKIRLMKTFTWVKADSGYYMFRNSIRIAGLKAMYDADDLIVFNPPVNEVYKFPKYGKTKLNKYRKVQLDNRFNCMDAFWNADSSGFYLFYKGVRLEKLTCEYRGDDLIASSVDLSKKFRLINYKNSLDNKIRSASRY
ncbi:MAG: hypothetical protein GQ574_18770 [Crocinitomix sp.]|nr:hypothetical protein [Crocinitomix sp.]